MNQELSVWEVH